MKSLAIIGSTGSIGKSSLEVYKKNKKKFDLLYLAAHSNFQKLDKQSKIYKPKNIFLLNNDTYTKNIKKNSRLISKSKIFNLRKKKIDYVISGVSSYEAIKINFDLLKISKNLLIANKETIICGGKIFINEAKKNKCKIIPIDSEHHCIDFFIRNFNLNNEIDKIYVMASGGPFLKTKIKYNEKIKNVLKHPTWKMGKKITIDSSTFANKVLEIFEAKILFNLPNEKLKIAVEETSNIHSIIELKNKICIPIIHTPSMVLPISNALNVSNQLTSSIEKLTLRILPADSKKFKLIKLGYDILKRNSAFAMILFVVLNERLVKKYIKNEIKYGDITLILVKAFKNLKILNKINTQIKKDTDIYKTIDYAKKIKL